MKNNKYRLVALGALFSSLLLAWACSDMARARNRDFSRRTSANTTYEASAQAHLQLVNAAYVAQENNNPAEAERLYRDALQDDSSDRIAWNRFGELLKAQGRSAEALQAYDRALHPRDRSVASMETDPKALYHYARLCDQAGRRQEALQTYRKILRVCAQKGSLSAGSLLPSVDATVQEEPNVRASAAMLAGIAFGFVGKNEVALDSYQEAVRQQPRMALAHYYLGYGLENLGRRQQAQTEYRQAERLGDTRLHADMHRREAFFHSIEVRARHKAERLQSTASTFPVPQENR